MNCRSFRDHGATFKVGGEGSDLWLKVGGWKHVFSVTLYNFQKSPPPPSPPSPSTGPGLTFFLYKNLFLKEHLARFPFVHFGWPKKLVLTSIKRKGTRHAPTYFPTICITLWIPAGAVELSCSDKWAGPFWAGTALRTRAFHLRTDWSGWKATLGSKMPKFKSTLKNISWAETKEGTLCFLTV